MSSALSHRPSAPVDVALIRFPLTTEGLPGLSCSHCGESVDVFQPDGYFPERLLGTCGRCGAWYLLDTVPEKDMAVMVLLPDGSYFRQAAGV